MIIRETHYDRIVFVETHLDEARREHCLCHKCDRLKPGKDDNCPMAETFFALCRTVGMAVGVSRCALFRSR